MPSQPKSPRNLPSEEVRTRQKVTWSRKIEAPYGGVTVVGGGGTSNQQASLNSDFLIVWIYQYVFDIGILPKEPTIEPCPPPSHFPHHQPGPQKDVVASRWENHGLWKDSGAGATSPVHGWGGSLKLGYLGQVVIPGHFLLPSEENVEDMDFSFLFFAQIGLVKIFFY